jgi:hypothetical protein
MSRARRLLEIAKANAAIASAGNDWWLAETPPKPDPVSAADRLTAAKTEAAVLVPVQSAIEAKEPAPAAHPHPAPEVVYQMAAVSVDLAPEPLAAQFSGSAREANVHPAPEVVYQMAAVSLEPHPVEQRAPKTPPDFASRLSGLKEKFSLFGRKTRSLTT